MKRKVERSIKEKIDFLDDNSYVLNNILNNKITNGKTVLETITSIIVLDIPLDNCEGINELRELIKLNQCLSNQVLNNDSDSYGLIFNIACYINDSVSDASLKNEIKDKLRLYTNNFKKKRTFSKDYQKFIIFKDKEYNAKIKKIEY